MFNSFTIITAYRLFMYKPLAGQHNAAEYYNLFCCALFRDYN
ncbi:hypothetical protein MYVALT_G_01290 [Candidatus Vallotia tarda]|uniref:Uncharacterized protein n=1 Tax=Candidatus Vallotiella hemipterorum TaxID=1177213 RepID=A0A916JT88_9BURK|nr:hypothetical protein MYVALT_G_01290 [Candidatus Vallotia tarda]